MTVVATPPSTASCKLRSSLSKLPGRAPRMARTRPARVVVWIVGRQLELRRTIGDGRGCSTYHGGGEMGHLQYYVVLGAAAGVLCAL